MVWLLVYVILFMEKQGFSETIEGFQGEDVMLPCTYGDTLPDVTFFWRFTDDRTVCNVMKGELTLKMQDPQFLNRAWLFADEWKEGNFSLLLKDLSNADVGEYSCQIMDGRSEPQFTVKLSVQVRPTTGKPSNSVDLKGQNLSLFLFLFLVAVFL